MQKKVIIKRIIITIALLTFLIFIIPIPINRVYDAIEIKLDDPNYLVECQVKIKGKYHINLFTDDSFVGQISVSDYKLTNEKMDNVYFSDIGCPLFYTYTSGYDTDGRVKRYDYCLGRMYSKPLFRQMTITVFSDNPLNKAEGGKTQGSWGTWNERNGYCIVPLADTREEAINKLIKYKVIRSSP